MRTIGEVIVLEKELDEKIRHLNSQEQFNNMVEDSQGKLTKMRNRLEFVRQLKNNFLLVQWLIDPDVSKDRLLDFNE